MQDVIEKRTNIKKNDNEIKNLTNFIKSWEYDYQLKATNIPLFQTNLTASWTKEQKQLFIRLFYHLRGHFAEFLWYLGSFAPDPESKELILSNIRDEFGKSGLSHEQLYLIFAESFGVDLTYELIEEKWYYPFVKEYIQGQMRWLRVSPWSEQISGFAAIEKLDNVDYANLKRLAVSIGATGKALTFYNVHISADHFDSLMTDSFVKMWINSQSIVISTFEMIKNYQLEMWSRLSSEIFDTK